MFMNLRLCTQERCSLKQILHWRLYAHAAMYQTYNKIKPTSWQTILQKVLLTGGHRNQNPEMNKQVTQHV